MMLKTPTKNSLPTQQQRINFKQAKNFFSLGKVFAKKSEWKKAIAAYRKAIELAPDWKEARKYLADLENKLQEKTTNTQQQIEPSKKLTISDYPLEKILAKQEEQESENTTATNAVIVNSNLADDYHTNGDNLVEKGEKEEAIKAYIKAIEINPELWEVHHKLGNLLQEIEELEKAVNAYNKSIELKSDFSWYYNNLGDVLVKLEKWEEAVSAYRQAVELNPDFAWGYYKLGDVLVKLEKWEEAVNVYRKFMQIQPDFSPKVEEKLNQSLHQQVKGKLEEALSYYRQAIENDPMDVESYQKALEIKPDDAQLYLGLGNALIAKAKVYYNRAIELDHSLHEVNKKKLSIYYKQTNQQSLTQAENYDCAISIKADNPEFYVGLGNTYAWHSRLDKAIAFYRMALLLKSDYQEAQVQLKLLLNRKERLNQAFQKFFTDSALYALWLKENSPKPSDIVRMPDVIESLEYKPIISIIVPIFNPPEELLREMIQSVQDQIYPYWELCLADDASSMPHVRKILEEYSAQDERIKAIFREKNGHISAASNSALSIATGDFIALLDHDDLLTPDALYEVAILLNQNPDADMIYSDEDFLNEQGQRSSPFFKPDWSPDTFLSRMYSCHLGVYRRSLVNEINGFRLGYEGSQDYDLVLRLTEKTDKIFHIPKILYHWRIHAASSASGTDAKPYAYQAAVKVLSEAIKRRGENGKIIMNEEFLGYYTVRYEIKEYKLVSIIIPTRNLGNILNQCLHSIFEKSTYPNYEVILIDNGSDEQETKEIIAYWKNREPKRFKCYELDIPFNYAKINNYAVTKANGDYLLLLNNDTEVKTPDWIEGMVEQVQRPTIGAVGAKLLYPDDTIQHSGVVVGIGDVAGHSHKGSPDNTPGYFCQLITVNNYSAVTGACLMCRREVYEEVGGLDEELVVAYNDVDLCLKIQQKGYRNINLPHVVLYHYESKSRGYEDTPEKKARYQREAKIMQQRWGKVIAHDPCYSPNLSQKREDYFIKLKTYIEISPISLPKHHPEALLGYSIDSPTPGKHFDLGAILIRGWVIGKNSPAQTIKIVCNSNILSEIPVNQNRPDVANVYQVPGAENSGFETELRYVEIPDEGEIFIKTVLQDGSIFLLGKIKFHQYMIK
ncbi:glycosyltransferase [Okeania hirsuta]|uniref:Glycosyltransferase n=2 Tax=Okeania TaxID=1458928 RepID=A0A3N6PM48_9CYAN|nr:glycosyltransferase [Okeania hirsuta]RQH30275.1 glycosyltransferase [Okeania hirsuta]